MVGGEDNAAAGAAIAATVARRFARWPRIEPEHVGFGVGTKRFPDRPNLLRVVLGSSAAMEEEDLTHMVLEANVDDLTGELAGHAIQHLLDAEKSGWVTGQVISVDGGFATVKPR